jgi:hypothetical protein
MKEINEINNEIETLEAEESFENNRKQRIHQLKEARYKAEKEEEKKQIEKQKQELESLKKINLIKTLAYLPCPKCKKDVVVELADTRVDPQKSVRYIEVQGVCRNKKCQVKYQHQRNSILKSPVLYAKFPLSMSIMKRLDHGAY